jgi:hypothetical protein
MKTVQAPVEKIEVALMFDPPSQPLSWDRHEHPQTETPKSAHVSTESLQSPSVSLALLLGPPPPEVDMGKLELQLWMASGSELVTVPEEEYGIFYSGECYVMVYRHMSGRLGMGNAKEVTLVYFWIGDDSKSVRSLKTRFWKGVALYIL